MPASKAQVRFAHAVLEGDSKGSKSFAQEVVDKMHGRSMGDLPEYTGQTGESLQSATREIMRRRIGSVRKV